MGILETAERLSNLSSFLASQGYQVEELKGFLCNP